MISCRESPHLYHSKKLQKKGSGKELRKIKKIEKVPQTFSIFPPPHSFNSLGDCWRLWIKETLFPSLGYLWSLKSEQHLGNLLRKSYLPPQSSALSNQPLRLDRQSKNNWEARTFVPASCFYACSNPFRVFSLIVSAEWSNFSFSSSVKCKSNRSRIPFRPTIAG